MISSPYSPPTYDSAVKRILHVITTIDYGGAEKQLLSLAMAQVNYGNLISVVALKGKNELRQEFQSSGVDVCSLAEIRTLIGQTMKLRRKILDFRPDIVHAHLPRAELMMACLPINVPLVVSRHNSENFFPKAPKIVSRILSRFVGFRAKRVIFISECAKQYSLDKREILESKKITVIYYGIENVKVLKRRLSDRTKNAITRFITVGRLVEQKDLATQIRAVNRLRNQNIVLEIIGDGELLEELQALVNAMDLKERVRFVGRTAHVMEALNDADCFILSSKYEGFGLVILEALISQIPIIASDIPTTREILGNKYPYLFKVGDDEKLVELMQRIIIEGAPHSENYEGILRQFDIEKTRKKTDEIYCQIMEKVKSE